MPLQGASAFRGATVEGEAEWRALFVAAVREAMDSPVSYRTVELFPHFAAWLIDT